MQTRSWSIILVTVLVAGSVGYAGDDQRKPNAKTETAAEPAPATAKVGQDAPDFTLLDSSGGKHKLSEHKDQVVVLVWLNKECPWSLKSNPVLAETHKKHADQKVVWLGIDSTYGRKPEDDEKYIKDEKLPFSILMDDDGRVGKTYGAKTTPHVFVIDKGKLVYAGGLHNDQQGTKPKSEYRNYLDEALTAVVAGKPVPVAETTPWGCPVKYKDAGRGQSRGAGKDKP